MSLIRAVIVVGQLGKIWAITSRNKKIFQSISSLAYFYLMETTYGNGNEQFFTINDMSSRVESSNTKIIYKPVKFDKRPW